MNTEVAVIENRAPTLTAAQVKGNSQLVQQVMQAVMKDGVHFGTIPGTDKPSLLKAGAEVLMSTFQIAVDPQVDDLSNADEIRYRVRCVGTHRTSGTVMGAGIGECSSNEEKYKWRRTNDREFDRAPEDRRRIKFGWNSGKREEYEVKQIRTEIADVANTVLKMAKKRALVDFTLTALAASDCFNQDLEDIDEAILDSGTEPQKRTVRQPQAKAKQQEPEQQAGQQAEAPKIDPNKKLAASQVKVVQKAIDRTEGKVTAEALCKQFSVEALTDLPFGKINDVLKWISDQVEATE